MEFSVYSSYFHENTLFIYWNSWNANRFATADSIASADDRSQVASPTAVKTNDKMPLPTRVDSGKIADYVF